MFFAAIYVPDFPVQALARTEPELRRQPLAVVEGAPSVERVIAVNEKAAQAGVEPGMSRVQAEERLAACAGEDAHATHIRRRSSEREAAAHAALLACACGFSPRVEDIAADTILLDLDGLERLFGPPAEIAPNLARRCSELGLEANVAVASNLDTARLAARGFCGVTVIPPGKEAERLGSLPVDVLFTPLFDRAREIRDTLDRWGIRNLRALAALPEMAVTERLGQEGLRLQRLARGASSRLLLPAELPLQFEEFLELEYPVEMLEPLAFILHRQLERLCTRLAARALGTTELRLRLELERKRPESRDLHFQSEIRNQKSEIYERVLRLPLPILDSKVFLKLLQLDLQAHPPRAPVIKVWLSAEPAVPRPAQNGLFLPLAPAPEKLELTLARIAGVVEKQRIYDCHPDPEQHEGEGPAVSSPRRHRDTEEKLQITNCQLPILRVGSPALPDTHRPGAFRMERFTPPAPEPDGAEAHTISSPPLIALRLFRPPLRAAVGLQGGQPTRLACHAKPALHGDVIWTSGPWRTSGGWHEPQPWDREEWDIAVHNEAGLTLYRIYRDAASGRWWVEGTYD